MNEPIHGTSLDDADKLTYLQNLLRGKFELVAGYSAAASNYKIVMRILQQRYEGNEKLKWTLSKQLREVPHVRIAVIQNPLHVG